MPRFFSFSILFFALGFTSVSLAKGDTFSKLGSALEKGQFDEALKLLSERKEEFKIPGQAQFFSGIVQIRKKEFAEAEKSFSAIRPSDPFFKYSRLTLARSLIAQKKDDQAIPLYEKVVQDKTKPRLMQEASLELGRLYLEKKEYDKASRHLSFAERKMRGQENYQDAVWNLALAQKRLGKNEAKCTWLKKLYTKYPDYKEIRAWGYNLSDAIFDGEKTGCTWDEDDFRAHIRSLVWSALDSRALQEIEAVKKEKKFQPLEMDKLEAIYYAQVGEPIKAFDILKDDFEKNKDNFEFLNFAAPIAARAGKISESIEAYYQAYKANPNSKLGRQALYQSAFMSYQFRNYKQSQERFSEFLQKSPSDSLARDAKWQLAWLQYLQGNYGEATQQLMKLADFGAAKKNKKKKVKKAQPVDRVTYWLAMSLYKQGKLEESKRLFERLANDPSFSFYRLASISRLRRMEKELSNGLLGKMTLLLKRPRYASAENLVASPDRRGHQTMDMSEEALVMEEFLQEKIEEDPEAQESVVAIKNTESDVAELFDENGVTDVPELKTDFGNKLVTEKFEVAQALAQIDLVEWAKWDLYDIESKVRTPDHLKTLVDQYARFNLFHRSSYIGQVRLSELRLQKGLESGRQFWEMAYPKAYKPFVYKYSLEFNVPVETIWAIMRAETQYRRDAISPVGALGLMQVMPYTGMRLAKIKKEESTFHPELLLDPEYSIRYGTRYLQRLSQKSDGALPLIAAGYNAGPHRLNSWLRSFGDLDTDEFIEHIPFLETRNYVKKVVSNAQIYSLIYGNRSEVVPYLASRVPVKIPEKAMLREEWDD